MARATAAVPVNPTLVLAAGEFFEDDGLDRRDRQTARPVPVDRALADLISATDAVAALYQLLRHALLSRREVELLTAMLADFQDEPESRAATAGDDAGGTADALMGLRLVRLLEPASTGSLPADFVAAVKATYLERDLLIPPREGPLRFEKGEATWTREEEESSSAEDGINAGAVRLPGLKQGYHLPLPTGVPRDDHIAACDRRAAGAAAAFAWGDDATVSLPLTADEAEAARAAIEAAATEASPASSSASASSAANGKAARGGGEGAPPPDPLVAHGLPSLDGCGVCLVPSGALLTEVVRR